MGKGELRLRQTHIGQKSDNNVTFWQDPSIEGGRMDVKLSVDLTTEENIPLVLIDEIVNLIDPENRGGGRATFGAYQGVLGMANAVMDNLGTSSVKVRLVLAEGDDEHQWSRLPQLLGMVNGEVVMRR